MQMQMQIKLWRKVYIKDTHEHMGLSTWGGYWVVFGLLAITCAMVRGVIMVKLILVTLEWGRESSYNVQLQSQKSKYTCKYVTCLPLHFPFYFSSELQNMQRELCQLKFWTEIQQIINSETCCPYPFTETNVTGISTRKNLSMSGWWV